MIIGTSNDNRLMNRFDLGKGNVQKKNHCSTKSVNVSKKIEKLHLVKSPMTEKDRRPIW